MAGKSHGAKFYPLDVFDGLNLLFAVGEAEKPGCIGHFQAAHFGFLKNRLFQLVAEFAVKNVVGDQLVGIAKGVSRTPTRGQKVAMAPAEAM